MKNVIRAFVFGPLLLGSISWAAPAFANFSVTPNTPNAACGGQTTRYVTQDNILPAPFISAEGIGNVAKANPGPTGSDNGGAVEKSIRTSNCNT